MPRILAVRRLYSATDVRARQHSRTVKENERTFSFVAILVIQVRLRWVLVLLDLRQLCCTQPLLHVLNEPKMVSGVCERQVSHTVRRE